MHYSCFGPDLDPAILTSLHPSNKRATPLLVFLSLPIFIISPRARRPYSLQRGSRSSLFTSPSSLIFIISSHRVFSRSPSLARHLYLPTLPQLVRRFNPPTSFPPLFSSFFEGRDRRSPLLFLLSFLIFIIFPRRPCSFEHRVSHDIHDPSSSSFASSLIFPLDFRYDVHCCILLARSRAILFSFFFFFLYHFLISSHEIFTLDDDSRYVRHCPGERLRLLQLSTVFNFLFHYAYSRFIAHHPRLLARVPLRNCATKVSRAFVRRVTFAEIDVIFVTT